MQAYLGIDDGNYDIKTPHITMPSGYTSSENLPPVTDNYLFYNGMYYIPTKQRFNYQEDKTTNERGIILTLFGIGQELTYIAEKRGGDIQENISKINHIALGTGLPPLHMMANNAVANKIAYYEKYMKNGISFEYSGYKFHFDMNFCDVFPQDYAAIVISADDDVIKNFTDYTAVDIGGGTIDIIPFIDNVPDTSNCISLPLGDIYMYKYICLDIKKNYGITLRDKDVENILSKENTVLKQEVIDRIFVVVQKWVDENIVNGLAQNNVNFEATPTIFLGGGSKLLRYFINKNTNIVNQHFLKDPVRANAKGYAAMIKSEFLMKQSKE